MKGASGFLGLPKLERVAHVGENLLVPLRDGDLEFSHDIADGLLGMVDALRDILGNIEADGSEGETDYESLATRLATLLDSERAVADPETEDAAATLSEDEVTEVVAELNHPEPEAEPAASSDADADAETTDSTSDEVEANASEVASEETAEAAPAVSAAWASSSKQAPARSAPEPAAKSTSEASSKSSAGSTSLAESTVRIDVELLNKLMNLVGELVLARNQILQFCSTTDDVSAIAASQRLNLITTELQEGVMKTRMQPISVAWSKLPRVVRDLSSACHKKVEVRMEGAETELDKTILEAIKDPLTHIVRNSVDHGIEDPDVRVANGKSPEGTLWLRAFHEGGQVNIEIIDDGGGINLDRVRDKAIENGVIGPEHAAEMTDRELTNLILWPGFSTAEKVTNVSGRGVGMDVVKTNIERIGGTLDIQSVPGEGTTLRIKIPLTLAIVPALIVTTCGDQYAIPQVSLLELVRLDGERGRNEIEFIHDAPVYRLRGNLLPIVYLDEQLELREKSRQRHDREESVNIVVLKSEDRQFGLVVDSITDTQEIVVKPPGRHLSGAGTYAGATIMGDGSIALILDVLGVARKSSMLVEHNDQNRKIGLSDAASDTDAKQQSLLIVDPGDGSQIAVRLSTVARLEEFGESDIESSGNSEVVQYRGRIMPLLRLGARTDHVSDCDDERRIQVVVFTTGEHSVGIVVGRIMDIVQQVLDEESVATIPGHHVVHGRVTKLVDLEELVRAKHPTIFDQPAV